MPLSFFLIFLVFTLFLIPYSKAELNLGYDESGQQELINVTNLNLGYNEAKSYAIIRNQPGNGTVNATDEKVKIDGSDTLAGYLYPKLFAGSGILFTILNIGGNEVIMINSTGGGVSNTSAWFANTVGTSNGNMGGYPSVDGICQGEYTGTHLCTFDEIKRTIEQGNQGTFPNGLTAWFSNGPPGYTANANDCYGWTSADTTFLGPFWLFDTTRGGEGWLTNCGQIKSLACCK